jgi:hypothetical protein
MGKYFDKVEDSEYSDSVRALVMAWDSKDDSLIQSIVDNSITPLTQDEAGVSKMLMAFLNFAHSVSFTLSVFTGMTVAEVINLDAQADYEVQRLLQDKEL